MRRHFGKILYRWRPRFGLRGLFLLLTVTCVWLAAKAEQWRGESAALSEVIACGASEVTVQSWRGHERLISTAGELRAWERVVKISDGYYLPIDRLEFVLSRLPNIHGVRCYHAQTAADYRTLTAVQRKHADVDILRGPCYKPSSVRWMPLKNGKRQTLTDYEYAEREYYLLKGWNVSYMKLPDKNQVADSIE